jgi:hypothetical protein
MIAVTAAMSIRATIAGLGMTAILAACVPPPAPPVNSLAFERRPPLPGRPGYLETIKYIFDGVHYVSPTAGFLVSNTGDLCFQGVVVPGPPPVYVPDNFWCMNPLAVDRVEALENDITSVNQVRLWCRLGAPQCAYKVGYTNILSNYWVANSITTQTVPFLRQRDAIEYLVYLMGGNPGPLFTDTAAPINARY